MADILIIEDDLELGPLVRDFLDKEGFSVLLCDSAEKALALLRKEEIRLVLLDIMLPGMNGHEMCGAIRKEKNIPILMMSALTNEESKLLAYELGADDYVEKPFSIKVLVAKIKALLRRSEGGRKEVSAESLTGCGVVLEPNARRVTKDGRELQLNSKEFELLQYLMRHAGEAVKKEALFNAVWGVDCFTEMSTVSVHIRWLREKLENDPNHPEIIQTVFKVGYRFGDGA